LQQTQTNVEAATGLHLPLTTLSDDELAMKETGTFDKSMES
jgi:hypothetical protein